MPELVRFCVWDFFIERDPKIPNNSRFTIVTFKILNRGTSGKVLLILGYKSQAGLNFYEQIQYLKYLDRKFDKIWHDRGIVMFYEVLL